MVDDDVDGYRLLFDAHPRPMFVSDRGSLRILTVNRAACELYGWSREEWLGMTIRDIRPPEELEHFERAFADPTKDPAATYARAARHRTRDGRAIDVVLEIRGVTLGGREASLAVVTDVTGIAHAERRFRLLVEHSNDGIAVTNEANVVEYVSPGGKRLLGYEPEEVVGSTVLHRTHPDDVAGWTPPKCGETRGYVARIRHRDGSWRWIESSTTNLTHEPAVRAFVSNYRDISQRKAAELALVESQQRLAFLLSATAAVTYTARPTDLGATFMSTNVTTVLGHEPAAFCADPDFWLGHVHPEDRAQVDAGLEALFARDAATMEYRFRHRDGTYRWMRDTARIVRDAAGNALEIVGYWTDVTEQVTAQRERNELFARMAVADRMVTVGTLAAGVAHEINNPLAFIGTNLELLQSELPALLAGGRSRLSHAELEGLVADSRDGAARVSAIVRDLRLLSRHDDEQRVPLDVAAVLAMSLKMAHNELRHRAHVVETYEPRLPSVLGDPSRLGQVFLNLLVNAAQAIVEGHAEANEIRIRARASADRGSVIVEIEDTGAGIPAAVIRRIFDPFFTTKEPGVGIGLGLSISHQIVRAMGGEIGVDSKPGRGTTFAVTLPASAHAHACTDPAGAAAAAPTARVLLIDDEPALGRSLRLLLAPETDVVAVTRAEEGLARLRSGERFDAIVCDLMMPEISGIELYEELAASAPEYLKRVIFMTGGAFTVGAKEFLARLDRPYLEKPFTEVELLRAIESVAR